MKPYLRIVLAALLLAAPSGAVHATHATPEKELRWYGYVYGGTMVDERFAEIPHRSYSPKIINSRLMAVGGGKELYHYRDYFTLEGEGQVAKHIGNIDHHTEFNALVNFRWQLFPWDRWLDTSAAWGHGLSYATAKSQVEKDDFGGHTSRLLYYMALDLDFMLPGQRDWSVFTRVHHRSGIYGTINNVNGGVNAITGGIKKRF